MYDGKLGSIQNLQGKTDRYVHVRWHVRMECSLVMVEPPDPDEFAVRKWGKETVQSRACKGGSPGQNKYAPVSNFGTNIFQILQCEIQVKTSISSESCI